jgi:hypothetical protein
MPRRAENLLHTSARPGEDLVTLNEVSPDGDQDNTCLLS